jgi:formylglycine-generating enzyme required for sulfatase activity
VKPRYNPRHTQLCKAHITTALVISLSALLVIPAPVSYSQQNNPNKEKLFRVLRKRQLLRRDLKVVVKQMQQKGVPYKLTDEDEREIRRLGKYLGPQGVDELVAAIKSNYRPVVQSQPTPSALKPPALQSFDFDVVMADAKGTVTKRRKERAQYFVEDLGGGVTLTMVEIPAGVFQMGSSESEVQRAFAYAKQYADIDIESFENEKPQHHVKVPTFFMSKFEVTQAQWRAVAGMQEVNQALKKNPSHFRGYDQHPVEQVT